MAEAFNYGLKVARAAEIVIEQFGKAHNIVKMCNGRKEFQLNEKGELQCIVWDFYDKVCVGPSTILYIPEHGSTEVLCAYTNFDALAEGLDTGDVMKNVILIK